MGLFPGVGDLTGTLVSALIVASATQAGLPRAAVGRMMANVAIDTLLGGIPFLGDLFDFAFKANTKNIQIYREHLEGRQQTVRNWVFTFLVVLALFALMAIPISVFVYLVRQTRGLNLERPLMTQPKVKTVPSPLDSRLSQAAHGRRRD